MTLDAQNFALRRRDIVPELLKGRGDMLVVAGLGSTAWDITAAGDHDLSFPLWGAMGGSVSIGIGLAIAQPKRRVLVITGDGEMLMGMGFQKKHAEKALKERGGVLDRAADWLFSRVDSLDSMDVDEPKVQGGEAAAAAPSYKPQYKLKGFISHVGSSTSCGHYVCHIKKDGIDARLKPVCP